MAACHKIIAGFIFHSSNLIVRPISEFAGYRFGAFEVDERLGELRTEGRRIPLQQQPFQVLLILVQARGDLITREELRHAIWPDDTFVEFDSGLNTAVKKIRCALGDDASAPRFVETIPKRGYRFIARVNATSGGSSRKGETLRSCFWLAAVLLAFLAGYIFHAFFAAR